MPEKLIEHKIKGFDDDRLYFRLYQPETQPKAVICLAHGMGEHSGRYKTLAEMFVSQGFAFASIDFPGHGYSDGRRWHSSFKRLCKNLTVLLDEVSEIYPEPPKILYGHDLGASLLLNYFCYCRPKIAGMIICSPWFIHLGKPVFAGFSFIKSLRFILPAFTVKMNIKPEHLSRNKQSINEYLSDPLCRSRISLKLYYDAVVYGRKVMGKGFKMSRPTLVMHGTEDKITSFRSSELFVRNTGEFLTLKTWEGCYHELHNEPNNQEIFDYVISWINKNFK